MKHSDHDKNTVDTAKAAKNKEIVTVVSGCKVKLIFPASSEEAALTDIKRMMMGGVMKQ